MFTKPGLMSGFGYRTSLPRTPPVRESGGLHPSPIPTTNSRRILKGVCFCPDPLGANAGLIQLIFSGCFFLLSNPFSNFINIFFFEVLNKITKWLIVVRKPPSFKYDLGRFVGLKYLLLRNICFER